MVVPAPAGVEAGITVVAYDLHGGLAPSPMAERDTSARPPDLVREQRVREGEGVDAESSHKVGLLLNVDAVDGETGSSCSLRASSTTAEKIHQARRTFGQSAIKVRILSIPRKNESGASSLRLEV